MYTDICYLQLKFITSLNSSITTLNIDYWFKTIYRVVIYCLKFKFMNYPSPHFDILRSFVAGNRKEDQGATGCLRGDEKGDQQPSAGVEDSEGGCREHEAREPPRGEGGREVSGRDGET